MNAHRPVVAAAILVVLGCTSFRPGTDVAPDFASAWGCNAQQVQATAARLDSALESGHQYIPQVGWSACDLLAHNGEPTRVEYQQTATTRAASWWYQTEDETHLVSLQQTTTGWVVDYVGW